MGSTVLEKAPVGMCITKGETTSGVESASLSLSDEWSGRSAATSRDSPSPFARSRSLRRTLGEWNPLRGYACSRLDGNYPLTLVTEGERRGPKRLSGWEHVAPPRPQGGRTSLEDRLAVPQGTSPVRFGGPTAEPRPLLFSPHQETLVGDNDLRRRFDK
jgi:hypothetical protein